MAEHPTTEDLEFCAYERKDRTATLELMRAFYAEDGHDYDDEVAARGLAHLEQPEALARLWLMRHRGDVVGYLCITFGFSLEIGGADFIIDELYIVPSARGVGFGRRALDFAEDESAALGARRLVLEVEFANARARRLYEERGYIAHERNLMSKPLG